VQTAGDHTSDFVGMRTGYKEGGAREGALREGPVDAPAGLLAMLPSLKW